MTNPYSDLLDDLEAEGNSLLKVLGGLDESAWKQETPAEGWDIADQVGHLAFFDDKATLSVTDADGFKTDTEKLMASAPAQIDDFAGYLAETMRGRPAGEVLRDFTRARRAMLEAMRAAEPKKRVPWYGPDMSAMSSATARLMETWAHGVDIRETVGAPIEATPRLRNIAHLGYRTLGFSFFMRGQEPPEKPVRVELKAPAGRSGTSGKSTRWDFGPEDAADRVTGPALDFCLLVTQRINLADTLLKAEGTAAKEWLSFAQCFAGPPSKGRPPREQ